MADILDPILAAIAGVEAKARMLEAARLADAAIAGYPWHIRIAALAVAAARAYQRAASPQRRRTPRDFLQLIGAAWRSAARPEN